MVAALLLSQTICFDRWKSVLPLSHCQAASWQRRIQRWLSKARIDRERLYGPLLLWAIQRWQQPGQDLVLALDTTLLWNRMRLQAERPSLLPDPCGFPPDQLHEPEA